MINTQKVINNILSKPKLSTDKITKNLEKLPGVQPTIGTAAGTAHYIGTEIEDKNGRWNDNYYTRDGYWVIHRGKYHDVYQV